MSKIAFSPFKVKLHFDKDRVSNTKLELGWSGVTKTIRSVKFSWIIVGQIPIIM